ncbi:type VI secretion system Vgr family protein [Comamonas sp. NoAH]|uniref:type VI secretion system Vgr family protein n=1 Tax=Comamonas halotolerans TaxID=3041496 RepID=UPI0024E12D0A|nr:type VI secretion system Vgr family protein [Comamonas sp. NoAH]
MFEPSRNHAELASLLAPASFSANARLYRLQLVPSGSGAALESTVQALQPEAWIAREALSEIGETRLLCLSLEADLPLHDLLGQGLLLHTVCADGSLYTRSGLLRKVEALEADGALARYRLTLVPWLWLATQQARSQIFQDRSISQIIEFVLAPYTRQGAVWHLSGDARALIQDAPIRNYCTQWRESDYAFLSRILAEEGLGWRVQANPEVQWGHEIIFFGDSSQESATPPNLSSPTRFHRQAAQETEDAVQSLIRQTRMGVKRIHAAAWMPDAHRLQDAQARRLNPPAHTPDIAYDHLLGQDDHSKGLDSHRALERTAVRLMQGVEAFSDMMAGRSSVRTAQVGTRLTVQEAPALGLPDAAPTLVLEALEQAGFNDLPTNSAQVIEARLGTARQHLWFEDSGIDLNVLPGTPGLMDRPGTQQQPQRAFGASASGAGALAGDAFAIDEALSASWQSPRSYPDAALIAQAQSHGYANRFRAIHASTPWRAPLQTPSDSAPSTGLGSRALAFGVHSAIVVGPDGSSTPNGPDEIYTNARGDIRIRFHWQSEFVQTQMPDAQQVRKDNRNTRWVRVAQRQAGPGLGWQWLPRIGQEVLVKFTDNDPDQPIVIGTLYNGQGAGGIAPTPGGAAARNTSDAAELFAQANDTTPSAQHNLTAGMGGGHAPAWHAASPGAQGHRNATALWGFKSKELGGKGYNQLVFDDSNQQLRAQMASSIQASQLNLGHIIHQQDNYRGGVRGQGFELRTDGYAALRGGAGVMLTTYHGPGGIQLEPTADFAAGMAMFQHLNTLSQGLNESASTHQTVRLPGQIGSHQDQRSAMDNSHAPHAAMLRSVSTTVDANSSDTALAQAPEKSPATGPDRVPHTGDAIIAAAAQNGLVVIAGQHMQVAAGEDITLASGGSINVAINAQARMHAGQAIGLVAAAAKADHEGTGLSIIAAQDAINVQAQTDVLQLNAQQTLTVQSAQAGMDIAAARKLRIATAQGAAITIEGGNITFEAPGSITYKASMRTLQGPTRGSSKLPQFPQSVCIECLMRRAEERTAFISQGV